MKIRNLSLIVFVLLFLSACEKKEEEETPPAIVIDVITSSVSQVTLHSAICGGEVTEIGGSGTVSTKGLCLDIISQPTIEDSVSTFGGGPGLFTDTLANLDEQTTYFVRAFALSGTEVIYGEEHTFTTDISPSVETYPVTNLSDTSVTISAYIASDGGNAISARGLCWGLAHNPTIEGDTTLSGTGTGESTHTLAFPGLGLTYYVRGYAINSLGVFYGNEVSFTMNNISNAEYPGPMTFVAGGTFLMGNDEGGNDEDPEHDVTLLDFYISPYEITNQQYADFMNLKGLSEDGFYDGEEYIDIMNSNVLIQHVDGNFIVDPGAGNLPVVSVTWYGARAFCNFYGGQLPTEAEWEYAAQGGTMRTPTLYAGSDDYTEVAWCGDSQLTSVQAIGTKLPNELGLYDMSGNVSEWCNDWYQSFYYSQSPEFDPQGYVSGPYRSIRGGQYLHSESHATVHSRSRREPHTSVSYTGFRILMDP